MASGQKENSLKSLSTTIAECLQLQSTPIAVAFRQAAPEGVAHIPVAAQAGCSYWRIAAEGNTFYTEAADHYNCPIGAYTHGVALPPERAGELQALVKTMVGLEYIKMEEVPAIPHRTKTFGVAVYAPLAEMPCEPDVILIRGNAKQIMLLSEAAQSSGVAGGQMTMGRPTCAVLPEAIQSGKVVVSLACAGNRVYTGAGEDEAYFAAPAGLVGGIVDKLPAIVRANKELETFHLSRR